MAANCSPSRTARSPTSLRVEIRPQAPEEGLGNAVLLLDRPVSFHHLEGARYEGRRNPAEASYIAQLVKGLLASPDRPSIGIVAFSEAQQTQIETALERLAAQDKEFGARLEEEYEREEDGQFSGLIVKNLENIQGDERDVILLSVCYGPGPDGRMLMNFGPINQPNRRAGTIPHPAFDSQAVGLVDFCHGRPRKRPVGMIRIPTSSASNASYGMRSKRKCRKKSPKSRNPCSRSIRPLETTTIPPSASIRHPPTAAAANATAHRQQAQRSRRDPARCTVTPSNTNTHTHTHTPDVCVREGGEGGGGILGGFG